MISPRIVTIHSRHQRASRKGHPGGLAGARGDARRRVSKIEQTGSSSTGIVPPNRHMRFAAGPPPTREWENPNMRTALRAAVSVLTAALALANAGCGSKSPERSPTGPRVPASHEEGG